jgi:raffinose/stachyose/melibiose transport system permease protein
MFRHQGLTGRIISQALIVVALALLVAPLAMIIETSFQGQGPDNYLIVVSTTPFLRFLVNSIIVAVVTVALVLVCSISAAYAIATLRPRGSRIAMVLILAGSALPGIALVVPLFYVIQALNLLNTYWAVIVPLTAISIPFGALVATNYIRALPVELYEAARIDGASNWTYFVRILVPVARPIIAVITIFTFLAAWNEYTLPLIFIQNTDLQVLTQVPTYFQSQRLVDTPKIFAASVLISLPIVLAYVLMQRLFREGMSAGAVK